MNRTKFPSTRTKAEGGILFTEIHLFLFSTHGLQFRTKRASFYYNESRAEIVPRLSYQISRIFPVHLTSARCVGAVRLIEVLGNMTCRHFSSVARYFGSVRRTFSATANAIEGNTEGSVARSVGAISPRVSALIDELVSLNMLEVKELTGGLKDRLGIDESMAMPLNFNPTSIGAITGSASQAEVKENVPEKTHFDLKLEKFDAGKKIAVIKEVRAITGLGLKEAKALVEEAPKVFKNEVAKDEAENIRVKLKEIGAEIVLE